MLLLTITKPFQQLERTFKEIRSDKKVFSSSLIGVQESIKFEKRLRNCVKQQLTFSFKVYLESNQLSYKKLHTYDKLTV